MNINTTQRQLTYKDLPLGAAFRSGKLTMVKCQFKAISHGQAINAVDLFSGDTWCIDDDTPVVMLECKGFEEVTL